MNKTKIKTCLAAATLGLAMPLAANAVGTLA